MRSHIGHTHTQRMGETEKRERRGGEREKGREREIEEVEREGRERREREEGRERRGERERESPLVSLLRTLIPTWRGGAATFLISSKPNYLPKVPPANTITMGVRMSMYEFWGETNIQSVTSRQSSF